MNLRSIEGTAIRRAGAVELSAALVASRRDTLATFLVYETAFKDSELSVPMRADLNPPVWELGHIGWFQEFWVARNPQRDQGYRADPFAPRGAGVRPDADELYDSSQVAHDTRWSMRLPSAGSTRDDLAAQLEATLSLLLDGARDEEFLYFFKLALLHEDMHHEAALYMAQALGLAVEDPRWQPAPVIPASTLLSFDAGTHRLGSDGGFAFDNELVPHEVGVAAFDIDSRVVLWEDFLPFVEAGGYQETRWWSEAGLRWLSARRPEAPRYLRRDDGRWFESRWGRWRPLDPRLPACHLSAHEAEAWCLWAGRRLPTEAEWERAAAERPEAFNWGEVWEWTASVFAPYPRFSAHPYRDYSVPWFGSRTVLRGGSFGAHPRMHHPRYRNFFPAERNDIFAGFRSCAHG
jgi:iron(II)-dependent oxidoreductase